MKGKTLPVLLTALWMVTCGAVGLIINEMSKELAELRAAQPHLNTHVSARIEQLRKRVAKLEETR